MTSDSLRLKLVKKIAQQSLEWAQRDCETTIAKGSDAAYWAAQGRRAAYQHIVKLIEEEDCNGISESAAG